MLPIEREKKPLNNHQVILLGAYSGYPIHTVVKFFQHYKVPYNYNSLRITYYRGKWGTYKKPKIKKDLEKKLLEAFEEIKNLYPKEKTVPFKKKEPFKKRSA